MGIESLVEQPKVLEYINKAWDRIAQLGLDMKGMKVDHIGIRIPWGEVGQGDYSNYLSAKRYFETIGATLESEAIIPMTPTGRPIAIYKLPSAIETRGGKVEYVEIPAPRFGVEEKDRLDHIEIVLKEGETLASFIEKNRAILSQYSTQNLDEIAKNEESSVNPDVGLVLDEGIVVKFHTKDIGYVVKFEQKTEDIEAIQLQLVEAFRKMAPGVLNTNE